MADLPLIHLPDLAERWDARLPSRFVGASRLRALVAALATGTQVVEDLAYTLVADRLLDTASGEALDHYGLIVGEARNGLPDSDYRRFIQARMMANRSRGTIDELIAIWSLATGAEAVRYEELQPLHLIFEAERREPMSADVVRRVVRLMKDAKPAGRSLSLVEVIAGVWFGWDGDEDSTGYDDGEYSRTLEG